MKASDDMNARKTSKQWQEEAAAEWDRYAEIWDSWTPDDNRDDAEEAADFLAELSKGGSALELGVGTGRVAIPLSARGVRVSGIDASPKMLERLREKEGGDRIDLYEGNFADVDVDKLYDVVFIALATLFVLPDQHEQTRCLENSAKRLKPGEQARHTEHRPGHVQLPARPPQRLRDDGALPGLRPTGQAIPGSPGSR